ncbi:MAG: AAA family ATPase [Armatimonadota bacterium]
MAKQQEAPLRIHSVTMKNLMRVRSVAVTFGKDKNLILIGGRNAQGKSSFVDGVEWAFTTGKISDRLIHDGAKRGEEEIALMDDDGQIVYYVQKIARPSGTDVTVLDKDRKAIPGPREWLDDMTDKGYGFDPAAFAKQCDTAPGRRQQFETLKRLLGLDFTAHDAERLKVYNERTGVNNQVKSLQAQLAATTFYQEAPAEEISLQDLSQQLHAASQQQVDLNALRQKFLARQEAALAKRARIKEVYDEAQRLLQQVAILEKEADAEDLALLEIKAAGQKLAAEVVDPKPLQAQLATLETTNHQVRENLKHTLLKEQLAEEEAKAQEMTATLERMDKEKMEQLAAAPMPIPGLSLDEEQQIVLYNGRPLSVASSAEKLRVSVAMGIAMLKRLKVILVREGSNLDNENLRVVGEMAHAAGVQVFTERVGFDGATFVLEDGEVADEETLERLTAPAPAPDQLPVIIGETPDLVTVGSEPGF